MESKFSQPKSGKLAPAECYIRLKPLLKGDIVGEVKNRKIEKVTNTSIVMSDNRKRNDNVFKYPKKIILAVAD